MKFILSLVALVVLAVLAYYIISWVFSAFFMLLIVGVLIYVLFFRKRKQH